MKATDLLKTALETEADVVTVRQHARRVAELLHFDRHDQTRIATAVSEIARNAFSHAGRAVVELSVSSTPPQLLLIRVIDRGPGIGNLDAVLERPPQAGQRSGLGLVAARRLMDHFAIQSSDQGTVVELGQRLPLSALALGPDGMTRIVADLRGDEINPLTALREQNQELLQSLDELKRRQEETEQLTRELSDTNRGVVALYAELEDRAEQLKQASELKSRFLSNMSHEFRTPLNSIMALCRILIDRIDGELSDEQERQIGFIRRSAESLLELVNDLLDLAKVEAGKIEVKPVEFAVDDLFGALRGALKPLSSHTAVELLFLPAEDDLRLYTDEAKVSQILRNLISNALKFTERGTVRVSATWEPSQRTVRFDVTDTGIGIAPADQERIFEEFTQVDGQLQRKARGTGLGLPLSRKLAELLGGKVLLHSVPREGSTFSLIIPIRLGGEPASRATAPEVQRKRILIVDDDETFRYVFRQMIGNTPSYTFQEAIDGEQAWQLITKQPPDVLILDLQMPNVDGFELLTRLSAQPQWASIPVVVSTSLQINRDLLARLPAGVRVLSKSTLSREAVLMMLRDLLGE